MELFQLRYFLKVVELGNFTRAAEACHVSQPALSQAIQKLEDELGQPVFERLGRRVELTPAGRMLLPRASQAVQLVDEARASVTDDGESGHIRVSAIPTIAPYLLPSLLGEFARELPRVQFEVQEEVTDQVIKRLRHGETDVALLALPFDSTHLDVVPLFEEELHLVLPADHALTARKRITLHTLHEYPFILLDEAHCLSDNVISFCQRKSFQPVTTGRIAQLATVLELVALGHGVSLVPDMARSIDHSHRRVYRSLSGDRPTRRIALCWNPYRFQSRVQKRFVDFVRATLTRR
ncbi:LysR family transcriptional regulator [bacterium]|nr:LysR family transcriptional regulator [bacterium]